MKTLTGRQLAQAPARAAREAKKEPVTITHRGRPAYVLMSHEQFLVLPGVQARGRILALLAYRVGTGSAPE